MDRAVGERIEEATPGLRTAARVNRAFLGRVVRFMLERGVRQFLDIASGIPTVGNVHEVARAWVPEARVVHVDRDPVAVAHSELMLVGNDLAGVVRADTRDPDAVLGDPEVRRLLDLDQPVGLLMLHWVPDEDDPVGLVGRYRDAPAPGGFLALTHVTGDHQGDDLAAATDVIKRSKGPDQVTLRPRRAVAELFTGVDLVEPGLVGGGEWRPGGPADIAEEPGMNMLVCAGVGRKP
ncbi:SAM-dependent methyltransferase [Saccharothrix longispora]|uniref:S-adenosyl methyltransferase n=1 Tax=Saccharothrix longispora TaxID=33920 RepID=A0ABU1Q0H4_9PSEU|nr:SAM-dependent methyltransferase [Saccharothrix longispora]MDR6596390.1 hypothetical protein [Saccharothrix longispora]